MKKTTNILLILLLALVSHSSAQINPGFKDELARQPFNLDFAAFADTSQGNINLEVYYKIFSSALSYTKWGDKFKADYAVDIKISRKGAQVTGITKDGSLVAQDYKESISKEDYVINQVSFRLPPDNYEVEAVLRDPNAGELARAKKTDLKFKDFGHKIPFLSTIEFVREATPAKGDSEFVKGDMRLIPSVSRLYGEDDPEMDLYYEIYNDSGFRGDYQAIYTVTNGGKTILADTTLFPGGGAMTSRIEKLDVESLLPDEFELTIEVRSPGSKFELEEAGEFLIGWSVMGLVKNDFKTAVEQLRYIATSEQMKQLSKAVPEDRIRLWNDYWKSKDPTPSTAENELKDEYYKRVRYADLNFGNFGRDGWKTDMGMVYITYGPPDEIERHPFDIDSKPYQIWYYYALKRTFRFVDINGYGEYELLYPYDGDTRKLR